MPTLTQLALLILAGIVLFLSPASVQRRRLKLYGLTVLVWSGGAVLVQFSHLLLPTTWSGLLLASLWAPTMALTIEFMQGFFAGPKLWLRRLTFLQCLLMPLSLWLLPQAARFQAASAWAVLFGVEGLAVFAVLLRENWQSRRRDCWWALATLAAAMLASVIDALAAPQHLPWTSLLVWLAASPSGWNTLLILLGLRLLSAYRREHAATEASRFSLQTRVLDASAVVERNFAQFAQIRVEQLTDKERKRIAADLHDELGAKLLTIVHTCDNERIATLGREALDEMRLSVRGLSGKPVLLGDALADWRAETVSRLRQCNIRIDWSNAGDAGDHLLSARTYVQTTRILREAVNNLIRHSKATRANISCCCEANQFRLSIEDNGIGLPATEHTLVADHGISSMKHRAQQMKGRCVIESRAGSGTLVRLEVPLPLPLAD